MPITIGLPATDFDEEWRRVDPIFDARSTPGFSLASGARVSASGCWSSALRHLAIWAVLSLSVLRPNGVFAVTFTALSSFFGTNGAQPVAPLIFGSDGNFYGTTSAGGQSGLGTVFRATSAGAITTLGSFDGKNGAQPFAPLTRGVDGNLYGTASSGGENGAGTVFVLTSSGTLTNVVSFDGANGAKPEGGLLSDAQGNLFGTTFAGGPFDLGTVFSLNPSGVLTTLLTFSGTNGAHPYGALVRDAQGNVFGTTSAGGPFNAGTIFILTTNRGGLTISGNAAGAGPQSGLVSGLDGNLYGTTAGGGTNDPGTGGDGTLFRISQGVFTNLFSLGGTNGSHPFAPLVQGADGNLYGTTTTGGARGGGTAFSITPGGVFTVLYAFTGGNDGGDPAYSSLTPGTNGNFYGTTSAGGRGGRGTFYQLSGFVPFMITNPTNQTVPTGTTVKWTVAAGGSLPLSYQWQLNSNNLVDRGNVSGTTTPSLTISNSTSANSGTYAVVVHNTSGSVTSSVAVLSVVDPYGTNRPIVKITSPGQNAVLNKSVITVKGSSSGSVPVAQVYYQLNGANWLLASSTSGWANWSATVVVPTGTNSLQAYALNIVGTPSMTNSVTFVSGITSAPITVLVEGSGSLSPNYDAQWLEIGRTYKIIAKPATGFLFSNWTEVVPSELPIATNTPALGFTMRSNLVLEAHFAPNPFIPVSGIYNGLFYESNGIALESSGFFSVKISNKGAFSGRLQTGGSNHSFSGRFDPDGNGRAAIEARNSASLVVSMQMDLTGGTDQLTGTVSNGSWTAQLSADRAVFDGRALVSTQAGQYTMVLPGDRSSQSIGDGYATAKVGKTGGIRVAGSLADGTKASQSTTVSKHGQWPVYVSLYGGQGSILGWLSFGEPAGDLNGNVSWIKRAMTAVKYYPSGFTNEAGVLGSHYQPPADGMNVLTFAHGEMILNGGNLSAGITNQIQIGSNNRVTSAAAPNLTLKFTSASGLVRGSTTDPTTMEQVRFNGVVLQNQDLGRGYFLGTSNSGQVRVLPGP